MPNYAKLEEEYGLPSGILEAVRQTESGGNSKAVSKKGAKGDFQFMPGTAKAYGVNPEDPESSARGAAKMLQDLIVQYKSVPAALAHYNGGSKAGEAVAAGKDAPFQETRDYLQKVNSKLKIDTQAVQWDDAKIDPAKVQWNQTTEQAAPAVPAAPKPSAMQNFIGGAKKALIDVGQGAQQLMDIPAQYLERQFPAVSQFGQSLGLPSAAEAAAGREAEIAKTRKEYSDVMSTLPGQAGYVVSGLAQTLLGGAALKGAGTVAGMTRPVAVGEALMNPATYKAAATVGAAQGALQPTIEGESKLFNALTGGALGAGGLGVVNAAGRIAQPTIQALGNIGQQSVKVLKDAGVPLDAAQTTGSALLTRVKAALSDNPLTVGAESAFAAKQQTAFNRAIAKTMGQNADEITPAVIQKAQSDIGQMYDDVLQHVNINVGNSFKAGLQNLNDDARLVLNDSQHSIVQKNIQDILDKAQRNGGVIDGAQYQNIKKVLDRLSRGGDKDVGAYARDLRDLLNQELSNSAQAANRPELVAKLKDANRLWGNMRKIEDVSLRSPEGNVSPAQLYNSLATKSNRNVFYQSDNALADLAAAGKIILPNKTPNSGTVARLAAQATATAVPAAVGAAIYGSQQGDLEGIAKGAVAGFVVPKLAQKAIQNPATAQYLTEGIKNVPLRSLLMYPKEAGYSKIAPAVGRAYLSNLPPQEKP